MLQCVNCVLIGLCIKLYILCIFYSILFFILLFLEKIIALQGSIEKRWILNCVVSKSAKGSNFYLFFSHSQTHTFLFKQYITDVTVVKKMSMNDNSWKLYIWKWTWSLHNGGIVHIFFTLMHIFANCNYDYGMCLFTVIADTIWI